MTRWWETIAWVGFACGDRATDLCGDLFVQERRVVAVHLDFPHCASHSSAIVPVQDPPTTTAQPASQPRPAEADVIKDARSRQQRERNIGLAVLVTVVVGGIIGFLHSGGGGRSHNRLPVANDGASLAQAASVRLSRMRSTATFTVRAPAAHAYDVTVDAPTAAEIVVTMKIAPGTGWTLSTSDDQSCNTIAGHHLCELHFAEGGNPGGTWTGTVHDASPTAAVVHVDVAFNPHRGDYPG